MWKNQITTLSPKEHLYKITGGENTILTFREVIDLWKTSFEFRLFFNETLQQSNFEAYFWEVKPMVLNQVSDDFEFVLVDSSILPKIKANLTAFQSYFTPDAQVVTFPNLGGDAQLVVPANLGTETHSNHYAHLANFVRQAPASQIDALWTMVGVEYDKYLKYLNGQPTWLSTAGLGVYWLHIRIDQRPKYYRYGSYKII